MSSGRLRGAWHSNPVRQAKFPPQAHDLNGNGLRTPPSLPRAALTVRANASPHNPVLRWHRQQSDLPKRWHFTSKVDKLIQTVPKGWERFAERKPISPLSDSGGCRVKHSIDKRL
jgi:hypothetical protein